MKSIPPVTDEATPGGSTSSKISLPTVVSMISLFGRSHGADSSTSDRSAVISALADASDVNTGSDVNSTPSTLPSGSAGTSNGSPVSGRLFFGRGGLVYG